jgi:hypothetical protein
MVSKAFLIREQSKTKTAVIALAQSSETNGTPPIHRTPVCAPPNPAFFIRFFDLVETFGVTFQPWKFGLDLFRNIFKFFHLLGRERGGRPEDAAAPGPGEG